MGTAGGSEAVLRLTLPDAPAVARAAALARIAAERCLPSARHPTDDWAFPVGDSELATVLTDFYADSPRVVAEVVRALRRERYPGRKWLLRILRSTPALKRLDQKVERLIRTGGGD